ncbi:adenosylcobinamide-GDP ribazoletransferase [Roseospira visakhapatnamensis]|uniref:Adenosylcobinamide-GDP ribazoletransferase n=1 Tax=Roseospira visakhapatnamensis TaxID=390880 RepID=A0A7W6RBE1_9PROT|nr:adenosylcobinamide-GDP ribazoletransferase [Roseospira visakhapatnamensis]MBB4265242.1 adenosylcobinamide-GDP ribazoletransferase [Roseospira visakhapatnamensis]
MALAEPPDRAAPLRRPLNELALAVAFLTRLPWIPADWTPPLMSAAWAFPWAGALLGLVCGVVAGGAAALGAAPWLAATLGVGACMLVTGCLHEDGIGDTADGIGSGRDRARSLEILRDSRIGTYGMVAVLFSVLIRVGALAMLLEAGPWTVALPAWVLAAALGRAAGPLFMRVCPPARADGVGAGAGRPSVGGTAVAMVAPLLAGLALTPWPGGVLALLGSLPLLAWLGWLARKRLGGYTGDVIGAAILMVECAALVLLALVWC